MAWSIETEGKTPKLSNNQRSSLIKQEVNCSECPVKMGQSPEFKQVNHSETLANIKDGQTLDNTVMGKTAEHPSWTFQHKITLFLPEARSVLRQGMKQIRGF